MFNFFLKVFNKFVGKKKSQKDIDNHVNQSLKDLYNTDLVGDVKTDHYFCWSVIVRPDSSQIVIGNPAVIDSDGPVEAAWIYHNDHIPVEIKKYCQAHNLEIVTQSRFVNDSNYSCQD